MEDAEVGEKELPLQSGVFDALLLLVAERNTVPGALRTFFQPIKTDDPRLDFYTMYKREASEYDTDYVKKYYEDLNTTLIFVRCSSPALVYYLTCSLRRVCFLLSARRSSST